MGKEFFTAHHQARYNVKLLKRTKVANKAHLKILRTGAEVWNKWRKENPEIKPDFRGNDFSGVDLSGTNLSRANLHSTNFRKAHLNEADLSRANLNEANLNASNLSEADLSWADLSGASLLRADLSEANLSEANLSGTNLVLANLRGAEVSETSFRGALLFTTQFSNMDLSTAKGLEEVRHAGRSHIDIDTIYRSKGKIPLKFLRGTGVPEIFIEYMPSLVRAFFGSFFLDIGVPENFVEYMPPLVGTTFGYYSCFISYSTKDQLFAERLHADLQDKGVRCWFAPHDAKSGQKLDPQIDEAIREHEKLLLLLSADSIKSKWVIREIKKACKREIQENRQVLFPVSLVPFDQLSEWECWDNDLCKDLAAEIRQYLIPDFRKWNNDDDYQKALAKLLKDLKSGKTKA